MRFCWATVTLAAWLALCGVQQARAQMPGDLKAGYDAYRSGQFQEAADAFGRAIAQGQLDRDALAVTLNNRGVAYSQLGQYDLAITDYLEAQKLKADDPTTIRNLRFAYVTRGLASANRGDRPAALQDYDRALAVDPNYLDALQYRGALLVEMGANADASADFRQVLALQPDNAAATAALAALNGKPATAAPAPVTAAPPGTAVPQAAEGVAPDSVQAAVARTQAAQDRAQAALDDALNAARQVEPTAPPEAPAVTSDQPMVEEPAPPPAEPPAPAEPPPPAMGDELPASAEPAATPEDSATVAPPPAPAPRPAEEPARAQAAAEPAAPAAAEAAPAPGSGSGERFRVTTSVNLRGGPGNSFGVVGSLEPGTVVTPDSEDKGWYRIPREGGRPGWVYRRFLAPAE